MMAKYGSLNKSEPRSKNRTLFFGLIFFLVLFILALQIEWVPYLNTYTYSSSKDDTVVLSNTNRHNRTTSTELDITTIDSNDNDDSNDFNNNDFQTTTPSSTQSSVQQQEQQTPSHHETTITRPEPLQLEGNKEHNPFITMFPQRPPLEGERFLAYLPHSGFHNQLITLENALRLAVSLNRTLLLPPLYLSHKKQALVWKEPPILMKQWSDRNRTGVDYCRTIEPASWPRKNRKQREAMTEQERLTEHQCRFYHLWTTTPWTYFYDIPKVLSDVVGVANETTPIRVFNRPVITMEWLKDNLQVQDLEKEMYFFNDTSRYEYLIVDDSETDYGVKPGDEKAQERDSHLTLIPETIATEGKFSKRLLLTDLQRRPERILHFGSLFATDRFEARSQRQRELKQYLSKGMDLWNQAILDATKMAEDQIEVWSKETKRLAPGFLGVHLRTEDGIFEKGAPMNLQRIVSWLGEMAKQDQQRYSSKLRRRQAEQAGAAEEAATPSPAPGAEAAVPPAQAPASHIPNTEDDSTEGAPTFLEQCRSSPAESPMIFMATDVRQPRTAPLLKEFLEQFPCTMFLSDFRESDALLEKIRNPVDNVLMWPYMVALMDANLAAKGRMFQGTDRSTFSAYIIGHLWPEYHSEAMGEVN
ncbi:hypothetical protein BGZ96_006356 [Linnemannia gamsii]|uniref:Uncharacterized protein n=1 Tax=Linnemannia gamsii TaxID=64522 RepID=A0ABQ7K2Z5_9FUNG|nr:hypothetical protein BGZ96_006356 [Linnemannia gamsii]